MIESFAQSHVRPGFSAYDLRRLLFWFGARDLRGFKNLGGLRNAPPVAEAESLDPFPPFFGVLKVSEIENRFAKPVHDFRIRLSKRLFNDGRHMSESLFDLFQDKMIAVRPGLTT